MKCAQRRKRLKPQRSLDYARDDKGGGLDMILAMRLARAMMVNMGGRPSAWGSSVASQTYRLSGNRGE